MRRTFRGKPLKLSSLKLGIYFINHPLFSSPVILPIYNPILFLFSVRTLLMKIKNKNPKDRQENSKVYYWDSFYKYNIEVLRTEASMCVSNAQRKPLSLMTCTARLASSSFRIRTQTAPLICQSLRRAKPSMRPFHLFPAVSVFVICWMGGHHPTVIQTHRSAVRQL